MTRSRGRARSRRARQPVPPLELARRALVVVALLVAAWAIVGGLLGSASPPQLAQAARLVGDKPAVIFRLAQVRYADPATRIPASVLEASRAALAVAPLAPEPFVYAARQRDGVAATRLLEEARRRAPRNQPARLMLIERYLRDGNIAAATTEIGVLSRLLPATSNQLALVVSRLLLDTQVRPAVVKALAADPLFDPILSALAQQGADPDLILALARQQVRPRVPRVGEGQWKPLLVTRLVEQRQYLRARKLWTAFGGGGTASGAVNDGRFTGRAGMPPFDWSLTESEIGAAARRRKGGLDVDYFGRASAPLARQLVLLAPGAYQLAFRADGSANGRGSRLVWRVTCDGAQAPLVEIVLQRVEAAPRNFSAPFVVPASACGAQWLSLEGVAAEFPTTQSAHIAAIEIRRRTQ